MSNIHHALSQLEPKRITTSVSDELVHHAGEIPVEGVRSIPGDMGCTENVRHASQLTVCRQWLRVENVQTGDQFPSLESLDQRNLIDDFPPTAVDEDLPFAESLKFGRPDESFRTWCMGDLHDEDVRVIEQSFQRIDLLQLESVGKRGVEIGVEHAQPGVKWRQ